MTRYIEEPEVGAEQADERWGELTRNFEVNKCPRCEGHGRVGIFACNACGATGQRSPQVTESPHD